MKSNYISETPMLRLISAVAALSITASIGGWIDLLAMSFAIVA